MAQCPVCQSEINITAQHFGTLFTCSKCNAVFFVDWNGQPEVASVEEVPLEATPPPFNPIEELDHGSSVTSHTADFSDSKDDQRSAQALYGVPEIEPPPHEETPVEEFPAEEIIPAEDANYDFSQPMGGATPEPMTPLKETSPLEDITDFGNADLNQSAFGYTITISGIDSGAIRAQIQDAISDSKFGWNVIQVMAQIKGGVLTLKSVNAVKASILIQRVKYFPVKISWRQDVLSSSV